MLTEYQKTLVERVSEGVKDYLHSQLAWELFHKPLRELTGEDLSVVDEAYKESAVYFR